MSDADNLNPARKAAKAVFLSDKRFKDKRENLINDIKGWLEILDEGHESATEFVDACKAKEEKYTKVLSQGLPMHCSQRPTWNVHTGSWTASSRPPIPIR